MKILLVYCFAFVTAVVESLGRRRSPEAQWESPFHIIKMLLASSSCLGCLWGIFVQYFKPTRQVPPRASLPHFTSGIGMTTVFFKRRLLGRNPNDYGNETDSQMINGLAKRVFNYLLTIHGHWQKSSVHRQFFLVHHLSSILSQFQFPNWDNLNKCLVDWPIDQMTNWPKWPFL